MPNRTTAVAHPPLSNARRTLWLSAIVGLAMFLFAITYSRSQPLECVQPDPVGCPLELDQPVAALLNGELRVHRWRFQIPEAPTPDGTVSFSVTLPSPPADYDLYVARADGTLVGRSIQQDTTDEWVQITGGRPGGYIALIVSPRCENTNLPYVLVASARQTPGLAPIAQPTDVAPLPADVATLLANDLGRCATGPSTSAPVVNPYGGSPGTVNPYGNP